MSIVVDGHGPLVSVCLPTFNRALRMKRAVGALLQCNYRNIEIIISDNGSCDETQVVGEALARESSRIRYFRHPENMGPGPNFYFARQQVRGKYFLWHGDDDYLDPDYIRVCVEALEQDASLVLVSGIAAYHHLGDTKIDHFGNTIQSTSRFSLLRVLKYLWLVEENSIFCGVYRVASVQQFFMPNKLAGDWMWMASVLIQGPALVIPSVHVHRDFGDSTSVNLGRIVAVQRLPEWHAKFPWVAIVIYFSRYLWQVLKQSQVSAPKNLSFCGLVSIVLMARAARNNVGLLVRSVPFFRRFYVVLRPRLVRWMGIK